MRRRQLAGALGIAITVVMLAACGSSGGGAAGNANGTGGTAQAAGSCGSPKLLDAAKKEGQFTWYSVDSEETVKSISEAFEKACGIKTNYVRLTSAVIKQRFEAEKKAGKPVADAVVVSNNPFAINGAKDGTFLNASKVVPGFPPEGFNPKFVNAEEGTPATNVPLKTFAWNTDKVSEADAPKTWKDLLKPEFKGKILFADPGASSSYVQLYLMLQDKLGTDYLKKLAAQGLRLYHGTVPLVQALGAGEGSIAVPPTVDELTGLKDKGAPISWTTPPLSSGSSHVLCLSASAPHPKAALVFATFLLSKAGSKLEARPGTITPFDPESAVPAQYTPVNPAVSDEQAEQIKSIFSKLGS